VQKDFFSELKIFFSKYPKKTIDKGSFVIFPGDAINTLYYVISGGVRRYDITAQGGEVDIANYKDGSLVPLTAAIQDEIDNDHFYQAVQDTLVHYAPLSEFIKYLYSDTNIMFNLVKQLSIEATQLSQKLDYVLKGSAIDKIMYEIDTETKMPSTTLDKGKYIMPIHTIDIARRTGLARETVSRELSKLVSQSIITITHSAITVNNLSALKKRLYSG